MKHKIFSLFFIFLISCFLYQVSSQETLSRTIYDFYSDNHESGRWKGYAYFLSPLLSAQGEIPLKPLEVNKTGIYIDGNIFQPDELIFPCDPDEILPCSLVTFKKLFSSYYESFLKNIDLLINKKNIVDSGNQCLILQIRKSISSLIFSYLICSNIEGQGINLKSAVTFFYFNSFQYKYLKFFLLDQKYISFLFEKFKYRRFV